MGGGAGEPRPRSAAALRIGVLSTFPPKLCGLATFAAALTAAFRAAGNVVDVVRVDDGGTGGAPARHPGDAGVLVNGRPDTITSAAAVLSRNDVAVIQHEYGIYGGPDGDEVLQLLDQVVVPVIAVLHTVPRLPTPNQRALLLAIADRVGAVVVMSTTARSRLCDDYLVDPDKVVTIPHGASLPPARSSVGRAEHGTGRGAHLLSWGLLGPGKGIEHVIDALAMLPAERPRPRYVVAGVTHPNVLAHSGDVYRRSLRVRAAALGLRRSVIFDDAYRDLPDLTRFVASAGIVVLPYDSVEQVTSGVLVDAIAAGRPVIATAFPHAIELLAGGAGIVVPHADPVALAAAIRACMTDPGLVTDMARAARALAPEFEWPVVAQRYVRLAGALTAAEPAR